MLMTPTESHDFSIPAADGLDLKARWWPVSRPRAIVIVAHGFGEHGGAYAHVALAVGPAIEADFIALDFRGHGRSPGRRGVVRKYEDLVGDLRAVVTYARRSRPDLPIFVMGHSNGGQVALRFALEHGDGVAGVIASNPSICVAMPVPPAKLKLGKMLLSLAPWITLRADAPSAWMTRDPAMQEKSRKDGLRHNRISPPLFFGMVEGGKMLLSRAGEIRLPIVVLLGGRDPVISPESSREFYDRLGSEDKTLFLYPKMLHEPFNELGREQVFDDLSRWLARRIEVTGD
jgi:alpha-beta hydrolase superfamily lysophospholipase